jgi:hypothetical protein
MKEKESGETKQFCKNCANEFEAKSGFDFFCSDDCQDKYDERRYEAEEWRRGQEENESERKEGKQ